MRYGENTTFVRYTLLESEGPVDLELKALVNYRDFHASTHAGTPPNDWRMRIDPILSSGAAPFGSKGAGFPNGVKVSAYDGASRFFLKSASATCEPQHIWYRDFFFPLERERGLDDHEDQLLAALFRARLAPNQSVTLVLSTNPDAPLDGDSALTEEQSRQAGVASVGARYIVPSSPRTRPSTSDSPAWYRRLLLAADQFLATRPLPGQPDAKTIIAGYHWFGDWGRDTMIALPGLALATGRPEIAKQILLAFSRYIDRGMLPNNFPDSSGPPQYNTIDATLWYFEAIRKYFAATNDAKTLQQLFPVLEQIVAAHLTGTRYNIHVDPADGLLYGGGPGVQLTWMDAKIGDWVVTPRTGKPVEVNALWINALDAMSGFANALGKDSASAESQGKPQPPQSAETEPPKPSSSSESQAPNSSFRVREESLFSSSYSDLAARARASFAKFSNPQRNCCFDVIDCPALSSDVGARYIVPSSSAPGRYNDASLRPNQILAVSLGVNALSPEQQKSVVDICAAQLLTPYGLRTLAPGEPGYIPHYTGGPRERDAAYHQGTVWPWLLGPFVEAHFRVYQDRSAALAFLEPLASFLTSGDLVGARHAVPSSGLSEVNSVGSFGLGTLPEIFDADRPHTPRGCISQAWSVAELLRAWHLLS